jgi:CubicO group peptidase (beta-lactamase class C family)
MSSVLKEIDQDDINTNFLCGLTIIHKGNCIRHKYNIVPSLYIPMYSLTKSFICYLCHILSIDGTIYLYDTISTYFPEIKEYHRNPNSFHWEEVTIHNLMNHMSGILPDLTSMFLYPGESDFTINDIIKCLCLIECKKPMQKFFYSDIGYILLGCVLERITQKSLEQLLRDHIFSPLQMTSACLKPKHSISILPGTIRNRNKDIVLTRTIDPLVYAADGLYLTVDDITKWLIELQSPTLISSIIQQDIFSPQSILPHRKAYVHAFTHLESVFNTYGNGYHINNYKQYLVASHSGGFGAGTVSTIMVIPELNLSCYMLISDEKYFDWKFKVLKELISTIETNDNNNIK